MLTAPPASLQREFQLVSRFDPAIELPAIPQFAESEMTDEKLEQLRAAVAERDRVYQVMCDTGRYEGHVAKDKQPTLFTFRAVHGFLLTWFRGECVNGPRKLTPEEQFELMFRLSIVRIEHAPKPVPIHTVTIESAGRSVQLARADALEPLYDIGYADGEPELGRQIVIELGAIVLTRALQGVQIGRAHV